MSTLAPNATRDEVEEEFTFTDVLLASLDQGADDYMTECDRLEEIKADLARRLQRFDHPSSRPNSSPLGMDGASDGGQGWWDATMNGRPGSSDSPSGGHRVASGSSGMKRALPFGLDAVDDYLHPSKRATPDPSNAATPTSSLGSFEMVEHPRTEQPGSSDALDRARRRQLAAEAAAKRQREQQLRDEELARSLSQHNSRPSSSFASSSRPGFQTTISHDGSFQRPPPPEPKPVYQTPQQTPYGQPVYPSDYGVPQYKQEQRSSYVKPEPSSSRSQQLVQRPRHGLTDVVDLTGSDDEDDDDLQEIMPNGYTPSSRPSQLPNPLQQFQQPQQTSSAYQMPGAYPMPDAYSWNQPTTWDNAANLNNHFAFGALGGVKYETNNINHQVNELDHLINGRSAGSSTNPFPLDDDDDDDDLVYGGARSLNPANLYANHQELLNQRYDTIRDADPTRTREEINSLLEGIRPDEELPAHLRVPTPDALAITLKKYQEMGLTWLKECEEGRRKGGVLADDMGLGKTIQMISLMVTRRSDDPRCKTTLIVAPVALLRQWKQEIETRIKPDARNRLSVHIHHGSGKKKSFRELRVFDVVITTYGSLASELKKLETFRLRRHADPNARPYPKEECTLLDKDAYWYRVILDEAQCIKNKSTQSAKAAYQLKAKYRFAVTGTPMMNNVDEFFSLLHFLRIPPYSEWNKFRSTFSIPLKPGMKDWKKEKAMQTFQALCKAVMLRRTKKSKFEGRPILDLPERTDAIDNPEFSEEERSIYNHIQTQSAATFNRYYEAGTVGKQYTQILVMLLRMRQACCHPHLIKDFAISAVAGVQPNDLVELAKELDPQTVDRIREKNGNFECNICFDATTNPAIFLPCGHDACAECFAKITDPANAIAQGDGDGEGRKAKCPNCRGQIDTKRITDFDSFKKVHQQELLTDEERAELEGGNESDGEEDDEGSDDEDDDDEGSETESDEEESRKDDVDEKGNLKDFVIDDDESEAEDEDDGDLNVPTAASAGPSTANGSSLKARKVRPKKSAKAKGKEKAKDKKKGKKKKTKKNITLGDLRALGTRNKGMRKSYLRKLRETFVSSAKLEKTIETLKVIMENKVDNEKVLIFSQWTSLLDLLEIPIDEKGWGYRRYDGSMKASERGDAVDDFRAKPELRIMLVSLKAGNAGLNLNMANHVIILDPFWNPYIEEQAVDRAHRLGQNRAVQVHRMLIKDTVEDRILEIQEKKRNLISNALDEKAGNNIARLGVQELAYLFGVTGRQQAIQYTPQNAR